MSIESSGHVLSFSYKSYEAERLASPWGAVVTLGADGRPAYDTTGCTWNGNGAGGGQVRVSAEPGDIIATGQRDTRGAASSNFWFLVNDDGKSVVPINRRDGIAHLRSRIPPGTISAGIPAAELAAEIRQLSSGTMATLSGLRNYTHIDGVRENFAVFVEKSDNSFAALADAWKFYVSASNDFLSELLQDEALNAAGFEKTGKGVYELALRSGARVEVKFPRDGNSGQCQLRGFDPEGGIDITETTFLMPGQDSGLSETAALASEMRTRMERKFPVRASANDLPRLTERGLYLGDVRLEEKSAIDILARLTREELVAVFPESERMDAIGFPKGYLRARLMKRAFESKKTEITGENAEAGFPVGRTHYFRVDGQWYFNNSRDEPLEPLPEHRQIQIEEYRMRMEWRQTGTEPEGHRELAARVNAVEEAYYAAEKSVAGLDGIYMDGKRLTAEQAESALRALPRERLLSMLRGGKERASSADSPDAWIRMLIISDLYAAQDAYELARPHFTGAGLKEFGDLSSLPPKFHDYAGDAFPVFLSENSAGVSALVKPFRSTPIYGWQILGFDNAGSSPGVWFFENPGNAATSARTLLHGASGETSAEVEADAGRHERSDRNYGTVDNPHTYELGVHFAEIFSGGGKLANIVEARKEASALLGGTVEKGTAAAKMIEESIELGAVLAGRRIVKSMRARESGDIEIYRALVDLYRRMPVLGTRTSSSVAMQAYSTPLPIAFLASRLAGIEPGHTVYEPTAGNGALLLEAEPHLVAANELDPARAENLQRQGYKVSRNDATQKSSAREKADRVVVNPPFGRIRDDAGNLRVWNTGVYDTPEIDHAVLFSSLESMKDDGRAVVIIGGKKGTDEMRRQDYRATAQTRFYRQLFDNYVVEDHFTLDGGLYSRQGAGWPIDVIVIGGRGGTESPSFPGGTGLPRIYKTFEEIEEVFNERMVDAAKRDRGPVLGNSGGMERGNSGREESAAPDRTESRTAASGGQAGSVRRRRLGHGGGAGETGADEGIAVGSGQRGWVENSRRTENPADIALQGRDKQPPRISAQGEPVGGSGPGHDVRGVGGPGDNAAELTARESRGISPSDADAASDVHETLFQVPYKKASESYSMGTLVPRNMATAVHDALARLRLKRGGIDEFVARELGYAKEDLPRYFGAEQIDAIAMAIDNLKEGSGFIIGDQTGIGKGRVNAAIIRWAKHQGKIPVFVTMNPELYASMVEDLDDIGMPGFNPLVTNNSLTGKNAVKLHDGRKIVTKGAAEHNMLLENEMRAHVANYDGVFTTYKQLAAHGSRPAPRRRFLEGLAKHVAFILDESHNAGGEATKNQQANIAYFVRSILQASPNGAFYSSATYAKRPDNMPLYFKTDMSIAVQNMDRLADAVSNGGIPMQQAVAAMLAKSGQYIRRERSFEGAQVNTKVVKINMDNAERSASIMRAIMRFDAEKRFGLSRIDKRLAELGHRAGDNKSTGKAGADSTNFSSIMHNFISQSLLVQKADAVIDEAESMVRNGEKVVIALSNTMGSMIETYSEDNNLKAGDRIDLTFRDLFMRYLEKSRIINLKDTDGKVYESRPMTDGELGAYALAAYNEARDLIEKSDFSALPSSPIDYILNGLRERGVTADEITGRSVRIDYSGDAPRLGARQSSSAVKQAARERFNRGEVDVLVINQAGSTGINLHSSAKFKDQRRRNMIIAQPELDINVFMQTLGRVFRTGQVVPPNYHLLFSNLPAEKRVAAVLAKKMGSLNANTTAGKESEASFKNIPDFLNSYGDKVAASIMEEDPELNIKLGTPVNPDFPIDAMRKVTGRIPVLPIAEQEALYNLLESEYIALVERKEAMGGTGLEAKALPLDAKCVTMHELTPPVAVGKETPFAEASHIGLYDVKRLGKPYSAAKVRELVEAGREASLKPEDFVNRAVKWTMERQGAELKEPGAQTQAARVTLDERTKKSITIIKKMLEDYPPGTPVVISADKIYLRGIVTKNTLNHQLGNPTAPGAWKLDVAVTDAVKNISLTFSQISKGADKGGVNVEHRYREEEKTYELFDSERSTSREKLCIVTGNILSAYDKLARGRIVTFSDCEGNIIPGIVLPKGETPEKALGTVDVSLNVEQAIGFIKHMNERKTPAQVKTDDKTLRVMIYLGGTFNIHVPAARRTGGRYYLNREILDAAGSDFVKTGGEMHLKMLDENKIRRILTVLAKQGCGLVVDSHREEAREYVRLTSSLEENQTGAKWANPAEGSGHSLTLPDEAADTADGDGCGVCPF